MRWQKLTGHSPLGALKAYSLRHGSRALRRVHSQSHWGETMEVVNEVLGTPDRFNAVLALDIEGSVSILHLLKFRETAAYEDGRETSLTGADAYQLYLHDLGERVQTVGGRLALSEPTRCLVLGQANELWDAVLVVDYPSKEAFVEIVTSPEILASGVHRRAALEGQLLMVLGGSPTA